jgi:hypothetical protein
LKNGILHIRTDHLWRSGRYSERKKHREKAHLLLNEWAYQHGIRYLIM